MGRAQALAAQIWACEGQEQMTMAVDDSPHRGGGCAAITQ